MGKKVFPKAFRLKEEDEASLNGASEVRALNRILVKGIDQRINVRINFFVVKAIGAEGIPVVNGIDHGSPERVGHVSAIRWQLMENDIGDIVGGFYCLVGRHQLC